MSAPRKCIALFALVTVTLCPFNCLSHKAANVGYFVELSYLAAAGVDYFLPPAPPRCQNETGCVCQGVIFVAPPTIDDVGDQGWIDLIECPQDAVADAADCRADRFASGRAPGERIGAYSGRILRALISSLLI